MLSAIKVELERTYFPTKFPEQSISARLRDLRKAPYRCRLERRRKGIGGVFEYQLSTPLPLPPQLALFVCERVEKSERLHNVSTTDPRGEVDNGEARAAFLREVRRVAGLLRDGKSPSS